MESGGLGAGEAEGVVLGGYVHHALEPYPADFDVANVDQYPISSQGSGDVGECGAELAVCVHHPVSAAKDAIAGVEANRRHEIGAGC